MLCKKMLLKVRKGEIKMMKRKKQYKHLSIIKKNVLNTLMNDYNLFDQDGSLDSLKTLAKISNKNTDAQLKLVDSLHFDQSDEMVEKYGFSEYKVIDTVYDKDYYYAVESESDFNNIIYNVLDESIKFVLDCDDDKLKDIDDGEYAYSNCEEWKNYYFQISKALEF